MKARDDAGLGTKAKIIALQSKVCVKPNDKMLQISYNPNSAIIMDLLCNERKRVDQLNHTNCELTHCNIRYVVRRPIHSNLFSPSIADNLSCLLIHTKVRSDQNKREIEY